MSREAGAAAVLGRTGDKTSKTQQTRMNLKRMFEAGEITLVRLQRSMGAIHSKVNVLKKKRQAVARAGGVREEEAEARVEDGGLRAMMDPNTRGVLVSVTDEEEEEEQERQGEEEEERPENEDGNRSDPTKGGAWHAEESIASDTCTPT